MRSKDLKLRAKKSNDLYFKTEGIYIFDLVFFTETVFDLVLLPTNYNVKVYTYYSSCLEN